MTRHYSADAALLLGDFEDIKNDGRLIAVHAARRPPVTQTVLPRPLSVALTQGREAITAACVAEDDDRGVT